MPRVTILDTTSTGFIPYYSGAHTAYVNSTSAGGVYANSGLHEGFVIAASTDINDITTGIKSSDLSTIIFSSGNIITGATGQGDIRGTGDGYFHGGTFASKSLDPSSTYFHGLYAPLTGSAGLAGGVTTGILGSGASTTPYTGSFTTDEIIYNFTPTFNTTTKSGSGIYTDKTLNLGLEFRDRANQEIDENHELIDNPFISGVDIDILNIDKSVAKSDFKSAYKETNFIFSPDDNEDVFGEFTTNFGVRTRTVNFNGLISTGDIFLYGNRVEIDTIKVVDGTGHFLDQNPINFISPNTGFSNSLAFTNRQKLNDFNIKGSINFDVRLNSVNAKYKNLEIYGTEGDIDTLVLNDVSRKAVIDITTPPFVKFSLTTDNGLDYNTDYHFKIIPSSDLETGRAWTVGPYRIASNQEASVNAFNDGADDQSKQGGAAFGTDEDLDPNVRFAIGGQVGRTLLITKVDDDDNPGDVGIATNNPQQPLDASNVARANIAASDTTIVGTDSAALAGSGHVITGNDNVVAGGETASISGGNFNFIGGGSGINIDHSTFSTSIGGRNNDIFSGDFSVIGGGLNNLISGIASDSHVDKVAIVGGENNKVISAPYAFIGAGNDNLISGTNSLYSTIIGGGFNKIKESQFSTILGGDNNTITSANHSVSAGNYSVVQSGHAGAFVFSDNRSTQYKSTGGNTLNLRFQSGVFVDTESGIYINGNPVVTGSSDADVDTLQIVTDRGNTTTTTIQAASFTGTAGLNQFKGSTADTASHTIVARNSSNASLFSIRNDGRVDIPIGPVNIGNNLYLDNNEIWAQNSNNLNVKADGTVRIQPQSYGTAATFATNGNVGIGAEATTPLAKLDVRGTISGSGDFLGTGIDNRITNNGVPYLLSGDAAGGGSVGTLQTVTDNGATTTNSIGANIITGASLVITGANSTFKAFEQANDDFRIGTDTADDISIITNGSRRLTVTDAGNVGIGTNDPSVQLDIEDSNNVILDLNTTTSDANTTIRFREDSSNKATIGYEGSANGLVLAAGGFTAGNGIFINDSNNVGIGTIAPSGKLDVNGVAYFEGGTTVGHIQNETDAAIILNDDDYIYSENAGTYLRRVIGKDSAGVIHIGEPNTAIINEIKFQAGQGALTKYTFHSGTTELVRINGNGNVGIGTNDPSRHLHVEGGGTNVLASFESTDAGAYLSFSDDSTTNDTSVRLGAVGNNFQFFTNGSEKVRIKSGGEVGIGTNDPDHTLHVEASAGSAKITSTAGGPNLFLEGAAGNLSRVRFNSASGNFAIRDDSNNSDRLVIASDGDIVAKDNKKFQGTTYSSSYIKFSDDTKVSANSDIIFDVNGSEELMRLEEGGNVGIGITDPDQKLHVSDNIRVGDGGASDYNRIDFTRYGGAIVGGIGWHTDAHFYVGGHPAVGPTAGNTVRVYGFGSDVRLGDSVNGDVLTVDATNGNVGIGTISPTAKLDIVGDGADIFLQSADYKIARIQPRGTSGADLDKGLFSLFDGSTEDVRIDTAGNSWFTGGSVGIGTNNPATQLQVTANNSTSTITIHRDGSNPSTNTSLGKIQFAQDYNGTQQNSWGQIELRTNASSVRTDMRFKVKSTSGNEITAMTLHGTASDGPRVGIGTTSPITPLNIKSSATSSEDSALSITQNGGSNTIFAVGERATNGAQMLLFDGGTATHAFYTDGTDNYINAGNVGIGITNPDHTLRVNGDARLGNLHIKTSDFAQGGTGKTIYADGAGSGVLGFISTTAFDFSNGLTSRLHIDSLGNVGIGTDSPDSKLHVELANAALGFDQGITIQSNPSNFTVGRGGGIIMKNADVTTAGIFGIRQANNYEGALLFYTHTVGIGNTFDTTFTEKMRIESDGNVGIGETSPSIRLYVKDSESIVGYFKSTTNKAAIAVADDDTLGYFSAESGRVSMGFNSGLHADNINIHGSGGVFKVGIGTISPLSRLEIAQHDGASHTDFGYDGLTLSAHASASEPSIITFRSANEDGNLANSAKIGSVTTGTGSTYNGNLVFSTRAGASIAERMRVQHDGNVGIGTTNPDGPLHIQYSDATARTSVINNTTVGLQIENSNSAGVAQIHLRAGDGDAHILVEDVGANATDMFISVDGTEPALTIKDAGNVGIGTTAPDGKLHVETATSGQTALTQADELIVENSTHGGISILTPNASRAQLYFNQGAFLRWVGSDDKLSINTSASSTRIAIAESAGDTTFGGDVGIGTTDPDRQLEIVKAGTAGGAILRLKSTGETSGGDNIGKIEFFNSDTTDHTPGVMASIKAIAGPSGGEGHLQFLTDMPSAGAEANKVALHLHSNANVGIGTTNPASPVEVALGGSFNTVNLANLNNGSIGFGNNAGSNKQPTIAGKSNDSIGLLLIGATNNSNTLGDLVFDARENNNSTFADTTQPAFRFTTFSSSLVTILRNGKVGIGTDSPSNALDVVGHFSATSKSFLIDHPTKENKKLQYASLEGPENGVYVRGTTDEETIELPEYWSELVHDESITVVLTPIGKKQDLFIIKKSNKLIKIGGIEGSYDYVVYGERKDIDRLEIEPDGN